jgi:hypothetical protein
MHAPEREFRVEDVSMADVVAFEALPDDARLLACKMHALWLDNAIAGTVSGHDHESEVDAASLAGRMNGYTEGVEKVREACIEALRKAIRTVEDLDIAMEDE